MDELYFEEGIGLYAISGDCAAGGLGDKPECFDLEGTPISLVQELLQTQLMWQFESQRLYQDNADYTPDNLMFKQYQKALSLCVDVNLFQHKWHARTTWMLCEIENGIPINLPDAVIIKPSLNLEDSKGLSL